MGKLLVLEGLDGSGKETQSKILEQSLIKKGINVKRIEYPNYDDESSYLVKLYLSGKIYEDPMLVNAYASASFYACDHYISYEKNWKNFYLNDNFIISDRYVSSNIIYNLGKMKEDNWDNFLNWIYDYEFLKLGMPKENILIYLDVDPNISKNLIEKRGMKKDIHEKNLSYLINCRKAALFAANKLGWHVVKCCGDEKILTIEKIAADIEKLAFDII